MSISNWGNYPTIDAEIRSFDAAAQVKDAFENVPNLITRGLGRSYGDASLAPNILSCLRFNNILAFDPENGAVICQSGVSLKELIAFSLPRGWFLPVTPGTKYVTIGGAVAADVHGKNHHVEGSFCRHVTRLDIMLADGTIQTCSPTVNPNLFHTTCGGMGLTGVILQAEIQLRAVPSSQIRQEVVRAKNLDAIMNEFEASEDWTYSVAWIDCLAGGGSLGRSLMMRGEHAEADPAIPCRMPEREPRLDVGINFPGGALNRWSIKAFNALYYRRTMREKTSGRVHLDAFFYPLDFVLNWNRIYGRQGFVQYQFVLPKSRSREGLVRILERIHQRGWGSFLAVLKLLGPQEGLLCFPMEGYTLALDFPIRDGLLPFLDELDELVAEYQGRLYLVKDARMSRGMFEATYPEAESFRALLRTWDPAGRFRSLLTDRLGITS